MQPTGALLVSFGRASASCKASFVVPLSDRTVVTFHLNSFQLIQVVAVFLVLHRSFAAWAVGGFLRESQEFSSIRSQTLMPSFVFMCSRQCSTEPPSQHSRPAIRRGIFFRELRFPCITVPSVPPYRYIHVCWLFIRISGRVESSSSRSSSSIGSSIRSRACARLWRDGARA